MRPADITTTELSNRTNEYLYINRENMFARIQGIHLSVSNATGALPAANQTNREEAHQSGKRKPEDRKQSLPQKTLWGQ